MCFSKKKKERSGRGSLKTPHLVEDFRKGRARNFCGHSLLACMLTKTSHCEGYFQGAPIIIQIIGQWATSVSLIASRENDRIISNLEDIFGMA